MTKLLQTNQLIQSINRAFPEIPLPSEKDLGSESYAVNQFLLGKKWTEVRAADIEVCAFDSPESYLTFMSPAGFCYFIPAYMFMSLFENKEKYGWIYTTLFNNLTPKYARDDWSFIVSDSNRQSPDSSFLERIAPLNQEQKCVISDFLYHQSLHNGTELRMDELWNEQARKAFDAYWYQFASQEAENN